ncbi:MAG: hypothetical protein ACRDQW_18855, partial [Haloechinothrix sp.]
LLRPWTDLMTSAVVEACRGLGWVCAARSTSPGPLRVRRGEYLAIDVLAFEEDEGWRWPVAAIELENSPRDDFVAYALWKACMVRADLSFLVCYRRQAEQIGPLVAGLEREVLRPIAPPSEVMVVVGTRAAADTYPDGYFRQFYWDRTSEALRAGSRPEGRRRSR